MRIPVLFVAALLTAACQTADGGAAGKSNQVIASPGKPEHPIQVELRPGSRLAPGVEADAELVVRTRYQVERMNVQLRPDSGMMLSQDRFHQSNGRLSSGETRLPFRMTPAADNQQVTVLVEVVTPDGRVMSREVDLPLADEAKAGRDEVRKVRPAPQTAPEVSDDDVTMKAEQEIVRDNDGN